MKKIVVLTLIGILLTPMTFLNASDFKENNNVGFSFQINPYQGNTRTGSRYRGTSNVDNQWKVNMTSSDECSGKDGCITTFWLEHGNGRNVSSSVDQAEKKSEIYKKPYSSANKSNVHLTAQNNNWNNDTYKVSGYWDEETW